MEKDAVIYVAGHRGLVGSAIERRLRSDGYTRILTRTHSELDLIDQTSVRNFFRENKIDAVYLSAARVGGIYANSTYIADFLYENLMIASNVIKAAADTKVSKLLFLGSTCIYPRDCPQPIKEDYLLTGPLEKSNEGYAIAKIAGLKLCEFFKRQYGRNFISAMPTNLYGPGDNYHPVNSHVIPGLLRRFHEAKLSGASTITAWGTGLPKREFLHVDDLARALVLLMDQYNDAETINVGTGDEVTIADLVSLIKDTVGYEGEVVFDSSKPDGTPRKVCDVTKLKALGWQPTLTLGDGLKNAYEWALENKAFDS